MKEKKTVAVIGGGVAGIVSAYLLQSDYEVTLFEKSPSIGGHTNTFVIPRGEDAGTAIDTGFIVLNDKTYDNMHAFLQELGVRPRFADMSFGFSCDKSGLQYSGRGLNGLFAQRGNIFKVRYLKFLNGIKIFCRNAAADLQAKTISPGLSLKSYVEEYSYSNDLIYDYVVPMGAAIWSAPVNALLNFPALTFLNFFSNHGLLTLKNRPRWQTVEGGSFQYLKAFTGKFNGTIETNTSIASIVRRGESVQISFQDNTQKDFNMLVIATHADQAFRLVADKSSEEHSLLGAWTYQKNRTVLHYDQSILNIKEAAQASWNYRREIGMGDSQPLSVTYDMNRLQGLSTKEKYYVTLNSVKTIAADKILFETDYDHPVFDEKAVATQDKLPSLNGQRNTWYCGSYFGFGFHEDAVKSAVNVARSLGVKVWNTAS